MTTLPTTKIEKYQLIDKCNILLQGLARVHKNCQTLEHSPQHCLPSQRARTCRKEIDQNLTFTASQ